MIRLFVGIELPEELRDRLAALGEGLPGARWVPAHNLHLTLRFIGEVDEALAEDLHQALESVRAPAFTQALGGVGTFAARGRPHTLWVGAEREPPLVHLRDKIESALVRAGLDPEGRKFAPHVTLAKLADPKPDRLHHFLAAHSLLRAEFEVERFVLFSSLLGGGDPVYRAEADYALESIGA